MSVLKRVESEGASFYTKSGKLINGTPHWALIAKETTIISIDDFHPEGFAALHQALSLKDLKNSKQAFLCVDGRVRELDIYIVDLLPKEEYDIEIMRVLAKSRDQETFFDVDSGEEILCNKKH